MASAYYFSMTTIKMIPDFKFNGLTKAAALAGMLLTGATTQAQTVSPTNGDMQSVQPFGLQMVGDVYMAASDAAAADFYQNSLPDISYLLNQTLSESQILDDSGFLLDPTKLDLATESDVRVYFIGKEAGYSNTLGFNTTGKGITSGDPKLIFPNSSSSQVYSASLDINSGRTASNPLLPGDFSDLGTMSAGTTLDFFLIADGANGGTKVYTADETTNPDGINHVISFAYTQPGSSYLIIGFEDLYGGGDRDFNDLLFAVDIGAANVAALTATPEPGSVLLIATLMGMVFWTKRRLSAQEVA